MTELIDKSHFLNLARLDPADVCRRTACIYDKAAQCYSLPIWNLTYTIFPYEGRIECGSGSMSQPHHQYFSLVAMHYLLWAKETKPAGEWISEKDLPGGATFFRGPHAIPTDLITAAAGNSTAAFLNLSEKYDGTVVDMADAACIFRITERIPVAVLYWLGDEDFPAEAKILYDRTITEHFALDSIFALAVGICEELGRR